MKKITFSYFAQYGLLPLLAFGHDVFAACLAWYLSFWLRFNLNLPMPFSQAVWYSMALAVSLYTIFFWKFGLYRGIWRYASLPDLKNIVAAVSVGTMATFLLIYMLQISHIPRSVAILNPLLLICIMGGSRALYRSWKDRIEYVADREPILVIGAGAAASKLLWDLSRHPKWRVVGLLDDNPAKHKREIHGVKVLGATQELSTWSRRMGVTTCVIAAPSAEPAERERMVRACEAASVKVLTVPSLDDLLSGNVSISAVKEVEIDELLGRSPVNLDIAGLKHLITDQVVLVSGAGGSIGSELARQILRFKPRRLVLFEQSEFALYTIEQEFEQKHPEQLIDYLVGDVRDKARLDDVMLRFSPALVFHAAAYKHVPLMESCNAWEAVRNNVFGTYCLAMASLEYEVKKFVLISTDKAVNPTNVMGATKRMAEMICQSLQGHHDTEFVIVRFGNVLGSNGSVVPKFREQIEHGGPITVTHPDITRYFMSIPEAARLVLQAGLMGKQGQIFVLDMGKPIKIVDLAREMIRLSGFNESQISIEFTGLRPGEKLYEELLADDEHTLPTHHPKLRIAKARPAEQTWLKLAIDWVTQSRRPNENEVRQTLQTLVSEYQPASNLMDNHFFEQKRVASEG
ncbi:FlaA1/EpsC-like NDP-sugar epimerase [Chitinivorax tropicus]|uniref:FlaA1/EpsC-like NDP-sugar epimerase n=1 Tax=Chitinivorax tropicus TaxID=714531 RepID=A0A840MF62_9PROT|nr:nucleoside-diphosphate sugar epimerase/dehydratase [Chitinivorax tropicus]MBB5017318.1 FlaA1/EpsC-like NDP-sugar epimerase [Chitinivorax tropicus]